MTEIVVGRRYRVTETHTDPGGVPVTVVYEGRVKSLGRDGQVAVFAHQASAFTVDRDFGGDRATSVTVTVEHLPDPVPTAVGSLVSAGTDWFFLTSGGWVHSDGGKVGAQAMARAMTRPGARVVVDADARATP